MCRTGCVRCSNQPQQKGTGSVISNNLFTAPQALKPPTPQPACCLDPEQLHCSNSYIASFIAHSSDSLLFSSFLSSLSHHLADLWSGLIYSLLSTYLKQAQGLLNRMAFHSLHYHRCLPIFAAFLSVWMHSVVSLLFRCQCQQDTKQCTATLCYV